MIEVGHRLSKIYTRTGDDGTTGLGDGSRVAKTHRRIEALGALDELNSTIGLLLAETLPKPIENALLDVQQTLFDLGAELSRPGTEASAADDEVCALEQTLDRFNAELGPLKEFILPGGTRAAALAHLARAVCRRAERRLCALGAEAAPALRYLNRLSDLLFVLARTLNRGAGRAERPWRGRKGP